MRNSDNYKNKFPKEYRAWVAIKTRCGNKRDVGFKNYGGRGIIVCDRWVVSFKNFLDDMGLSPSTNHSLDRINNNGNYELANCRWATRLEQNNNKRNTKFLTIDGIVKSRSEWAKCKNINYRTLLRRIELNWPNDKLFNPVHA